ncbi:MAG: NAD-dependent dehydratase, partial [Casimicrobiaceae bacterium]
RLYRVPPALLRAGAMLAGRRGAVARLLDTLEVDAGRFCELARWRPPYTADEGLHETAAAWKLRHRL